MSTAPLPIMFNTLLGIDFASHCNDYVLGYCCLFNRSVSLSLALICVSLMLLKRIISFMYF